MKKQTKRLSLSATKGSFSQFVIFAGIAVLFSASSALAVDFNRDGIDDLVIGDATAKNNGVDNMGHVAIVMKQPDGSFEANIWTRQRIDGLDHQSGAFFGNSVSAGDFNGDSYPDLAISASAESLDSVVGYKSGAVYLVYGTASGLVNSTSSYSTLLTGSTVAAYNQFGKVMTTGDFNGDGIDDLAIGSPNRNVRGQTNSWYGQGHGAVDVYFGSTMGLSNNDMVELNQRFIPASYPEVGGAFGAALASGDFNNDGKDDLLIGAPALDITNANGIRQEDAGAVTVVFGNSGGLNPRSSFQTWDKTNDNNSGDTFGKTLVTLDYNGDGYDDFVIGHEGESIGNKKAAGAVTVYQGHKRIHTWGFAIGTLWYQNKAGVPGTSEAGDMFGAALAAGDFNDDGKDDLAIGVAHETFNGTFSDIEFAGLTHVLYGNSNGLSNGGILHQGKDGVQGTREDGDRFGSSLAAGDYDGDGIDDLMVGVSGESIPGISSGKGMAMRITGGYAGLKPTAGQQQMFHKGFSSIKGMGSSRNIGYTIE